MRSSLSKPVDLIGFRHLLTGFYDRASTTLPAAAGGDGGRRGNVLFIVPFSRHPVPCFAGHSRP